MKRNESCITTWSESHFTETSGPTEGLERCFGGAWIPERFLTKLMIPEPLFQIHNNTQPVPFLMVKHILPSFVLGPQASL